MIVNTTGKNMVLDAGAISKAVLKAAGPQIQVEVNTKAPKGVSFSQVIQSSGGNLSQKTGLKAIYHGSVAGYDGGKGQKVCTCYIRWGLDGKYSWQYDAAIRAYGISSCTFYIIWDYISQGMGACHANCIHCMLLI